MKHSKTLLLTLLGWAVSCQLTSAATRTWTGAGADARWSNPTNWAGNVAPVELDSLVFPPGAASLTASNDFAPGFRIGNVTIGAGGYRILGTNTVLWSGQSGFTQLLATNTSGTIHWHPGLVSGQSAPRLTNRAGGTLVFHGPMLFTNGLAVGPLYADAGGDMEFRAGVECFEIRKYAGGILSLLASNLCYVASWGGTVRAGHPLALGPYDYALFDNGSTLQLTNGITVTNKLLLYDNGRLEGLGNVTNEWRGPISSFSTNRFGADTGVLLVSGPISGNPAYLIKTLPGKVVLTATNSFPGNTTVSAGNLVVNGTLNYPVTVLPGATLSGTGSLSTVTVQAGGKLAPGGDTPGRLKTFNLQLLPGAILEAHVAGATPGTEYDQITLQGNAIAWLTNAILSLTVPTNPITGATFMIITNDFTDPTSGGFTNLAQGTIFTNNGKAFQISYTGGDGNDVTLTKLVAPSGVTRTWTGLGADARWSTPANWAGGVAPNEGDDLVFPSGAAQLNNTNDFFAEATFNSISLNEANYTLNGNLIRLPGGIHANLPAGEAAFRIPLSLQQAQTFTNSGAGTLNFAAPINNNGHALTLNVTAGTNSFQTGGAIAGAGGLIKNGAGTLRFTGVTANTYTGTTTVNAGTVELAKSNLVTAIPGNLVIGDGAGGPGADVVRSFAAQQIASASQVAVAGSGLLDLGAGNQPLAGLTGTGAVVADGQLVVNLAGTNVFNGGVTGGGSLVKSGVGLLVLTCTNTYSGLTTISNGTLQVDGLQPNSSVRVVGGRRLQGSGTVGPIDFLGSGNFVAPGSGPGILTCGNFNANTTGTGTLTVDLDGLTPGSGYDRLNVNGTVTLTGLELVATLTFNSPPGTQFLIVNNDSSDAIVGTFNGKPESSTFTVGGAQFQITYAGGDGNDVVLTQLTAVPSGLGIPLTGTNYTQNFDSLAQGGSANVWSNGVTLDGWYAQSGSGGNVTTYRGTNGNDTAGALYSFGATGNSDRALGSLPSNATGTFGFGLCFTNPHPYAVSNFTVSYTGEQWRSGGSGSVTNTLSFGYRVGFAVIVNTDPGTNTGWTAVSALNFNSPTVTATAGPLNGNDSTNRVVFSSVPIPGLTVAPGQTLFLRWVDPNDTGADQGMAIDDLTVTWSGAPAAAPAQFSGGALTNGFLRITGTGTPGASYQIQTATNFIPPVTWLPVGTATADGSGNLSFTDLANPPTEPMRFYRAVNQ
ncbi:MAG: beta strand repeat-containing protein [Limisphaerales bacterium]